MGRAVLGEGSTKQPSHTPILRAGPGARPLAHGFGRIRLGCTACCEPMLVWPAGARPNLSAITCAGTSVAERPPYCSCGSSA